MTRRKLIIGITLLIMGFILLSIPLYDGWKQSKKIQSLEQALDLIHEQDVSENVQNDGLEKQTEIPLSNEQINNIVELEIPSIGLKENVLDETTEENLSIALTQLKQNQIPGEGNFAIAGHRGYLSKTFFRNLPEVKQGDKIILHAQKEYVYKVSDIQVIEPNEVEIVNDREGKNEITLITCTTSGLKRIAVTGELTYVRDK